MSTNTKKFFGLGRGLGSLIPEKTALSVATLPQESVFYVETDKIKPNSSQPRKHFDQGALASLSSSIKRYGILQPLLVTKVEKPTNQGLAVEYHLLAGERRWRAAQLASLPRVPVIIKDAFKEEQERLEIALIENVQREDLNPLEEALAYRRFSEEFGLTQQEIAQKVSKSREVVANALRLLGLPQDIQDKISAGQISRTQARALLAFKDPKEQQAMLASFISGQATVRSAEVAARGPQAKKEVSNKFKDLESNLSQNVGAPVLIQSGQRGGKIVIRFADLEELNKIAKVILD
ncbi:MAG: chromosome partitioning protein ParB [Candidatus Yanofskybacteria bacterium CG10_big_fil_rev_8_21_14_0_10_46_23]|uniref:Chromosome partitioning protein ParB n=1 Tax=Candidatus Yanofskybacteria bacterium CG10_big_fil_rev_8_21_14_0_10_46_23 TaxID=1975098 RepID=A0A2H0R3N4_9BACT|nr:MAG: chromosome partitioning protein ParB [Candidatus Yanofskybacteria bacterium CG10_big_fil_rev_8_21_14_0_10_46_23]